MGIRKALHPNEKDNDIMEHLVLHLTEDAMLDGPSQYRSVWAIERYHFIIYFS